MKNGEQVLINYKEAKVVQYKFAGELEKSTLRSALQSKTALDILSSSAIQ